jgi:hypothetical protein
MASRFVNFNDKPVPIEAEIPTYSNRMLENKSKSSASKFQSIVLEGYEQNLNNEEIAQKIENDTAPADLKKLLDTAPNIYEK